VEVKESSDDNSWSPRSAAGVIGQFQMVAWRFFPAKSNQQTTEQGSAFVTKTTMADVLSSGDNRSAFSCSGGGNHPPPPTSCKKDILVQCDDITDVVEKFIKVAHGPEALENNRARENARENIRKKLALEAGKEKSDSCDLQLCFVNEFASDEDLSDAKEEVDASGQQTAAQEIVKANISQKMSQIIVPISYTTAASESDYSNVPSSSSLTNQSDTISHFHLEVRRLQRTAKDNLLKARIKAQQEIQDQMNTRQQNNQKLFSLVGLPLVSKVSRRSISRLNVAQLQLIQNDYLAQIEKLNDDLVSQLLVRDELVIEQDARLTDIQDLSQFTNFQP